MRHPIEEYLDYLKRKGLHEFSITVRRRILNRFYSYLVHNGVKEAGKENILRYQRYLMEDYEKTRGGRLKIETIVNRLMTVKDYFRYLTEEKKKYLFNPARGLEIPKKRQIIRDIPTEKEMKEILEGINLLRREGRKDKAILELLYSSGLRARELLNLNIYDIDFKGGRIFVKQGKGRKDRVVPLGKQAAQSVRSYMDEVRTKYARSSLEKGVFLDEAGKRMSYPQLLRVTIRNRGKTTLNPHKVRHACAIGMLRNGADVRYIQELLGHKRLSTTQIYLQLFPKDLKEAHQKYHPHGRG